MKAKQYFNAQGRRDKSREVPYTRRKGLPDWAQLAYFNGYLEQTNR